jgi:hypothetical protein
MKGDEEKKQAEKPIRMMDRDYQHELPESQVNELLFYRNLLFCIQLYLLNRPVKS